MEKIRVMYDEQIFLLQDYGGISRYFTELIKTFHAHPEMGVVPLLSSRTVRNQYLLGETDFLELRRVDSRLSALWHLIFRALVTRETNEPVDLVHQTFYLPGFFSRFGKRPKAVTLFDMIPENTESNTKFWNPHFAKKYILPKADLVFSISESSTKDMFVEYGIKIDVTTTYLGVGPEYQPKLPKFEWQPEKYFLFVGNRDGYKDCELAIRSFAKVAKKLPGVHLFLVGGGSLKKSEKDLIFNLGVEEAIFQRSVSTEELPNVYSNSRGLIYTSRYEGFGLPLVEAMASGVAVLASDTPINREIARDCATFFPVGDEELLSNLMVQLISNPHVFQDKVMFGEARSKDFTWKKCAELTASEYRRIIERQKVKG
jgi:glycosyltransferase involved in cell wall biosynthesis